MFLTKKSFCGIFFIILFIYAGANAVLTLNKISKEVVTPSYETVMNGSWATQFESKLNLELVHYDPSVLFWGLTKYNLFNEGKKGVIIGNDGWLFSKEEFQYHADIQNEFQIKKEYIISVSDELSKKNIDLYVVILPAKRRIYSEKIEDIQYQEALNSLYSNFLNSLSEENIKTININRTMQKYKNAYPDNLLFLKTDTHWSVKGADLSAQEIAEEIDANHGNLIDQIKYNMEEESISHKGDLMDYIPLGSNSIYKDENVIKRTAILNDVPNDLFGDIDIPFTLVGTSYSANKLWGFEASLKFYLGNDILNMSDEGQGPFIMMQDYLLSDEFKNTPPKVVIWEIPERYIPIKYNLEKL